MIGSRIAVEMSSTDRITKKRTHFVALKIEIWVFLYMDGAANSIIRVLPNKLKSHDQATVYVLFRVFGLRCSWITYLKCKTHIHSIRVRDISKVKIVFRFFISFFFIIIHIQVVLL